MYTNCFDFQNNNKSDMSSEMWQCPRCQFSLYDLEVDKCLVRCRSCFYEGEMDSSVESVIVRIVPVSSPGKDSTL